MSRAIVAGLALAHVGTGFVARRLGLVILAAPVLAALVLAPAAYAYQCEQPPHVGSGHCYAFVDWPGETPGASSTIYASFMFPGSATDSQDAVISNEVWLRQQNFPGCAEAFGNLTYAACWIEAGYGADQNDAPNGMVFWAYRPRFSTYVLFPQSVGYPLGSWTTFTIARPDEAHHEQYQIHFFNWDSRYYFDFYTGLIENFMEPNDIHVGQELGGYSNVVTHPAAANPSWMIWNQYQGYGPNDWYYQFSDGLRTAFNPPFGDWAYPPSSGVVQGGEWEDDCC